jgi:hypothetical protein
LKLLKIPVWEALAAALGAASGVPNTFQNRNVSSAAADATVHPSGLCRVTTMQSKQSINRVFTTIHARQSRARV